MSVVKLFSNAVNHLEVVDTIDVFTGGPLMSNLLVLASKVWESIDSLFQDSLAAWEGSRWTSIDTVAVSWVKRHR